VVAAILALPAATPVTVPLDETVAIVEFVVDHVKFRPGTGNPALS
jgi:hypothetical protein